MIDRDEKVDKIAKHVAQGGWSSIHSLAEKLDDDAIEDYYHLWETEEEDEGD